MHNVYVIACGLIAIGMLICVLGKLGFIVGARKSGVSRILMHHLAILVCRQALKGGQ